MKVYYFTSESDSCGPSTELFATEAEMLAAYADFVTETWEGLFPGEPLPTDDGAPDLEAAWERCCLTTIDTYDMGEQDIVFPAPTPKPEKRYVVSACCRAQIGWDAWVDENGDVCGGPYDNSQCMECGKDNPEEVYEDEIAAQDEVES